MDTKWIWGIGALILAAIAATVWVEAKKNAVDHAPPPVLAPTPAAESTEISPTMDTGNSAPPTNNPPPPSTGSAPPPSGAAESPPAYSPPPYQPVSPEYNEPPPPPPQNYGGEESYDSPEAAPQIPGGVNYDGGVNSTGGDNDFSNAPPPPAAIAPPVDE